MFPFSDRRIVSYASLLFLKNIFHRKDASKSNTCKSIQIQSNQD